jgi:hypothetical protein
MNRIEQMKRVQKEGLELFTKKNRDYGDSFANYGTVGVIVRMGDKINRLTSITKSGVTMVETESIRDTLIDLHNYAAMAIMLMDEKSTKTDKKETHTVKNPTLGLPKNDSVGHELYLEDTLASNRF